MNENNTGQDVSKKRGLNIIAIAVIIGLIPIMIIVGRMYLKESSPTAPITQPPPEPRAVAPVEEKAVIDYDRLGHDEAFDREMQERKDKYQLTDGIEMIVREDESVKVGDSTVSMEEIKEKSDLGKGRVVEKDLQKITAVNKQDVKEYGIHVVRPGDNIWNIHFALLMDYFRKRNITVSSTADEPFQNGTSSGIGKVLKFSENTVTIYNLKKERIELDLDMIHPFEKIVVYQMDEVFQLLSQIDYQEIDNLRFDGTTLWFPAGGN